MKKLTLITSLSIIFIVNVYPQWTNQNPVPDGNDLWSTFFVDDSTGWIVGSEGFIKKTTNSGVDWIEQKSGTTLILKSVQFITQNTGWICGEGGLILKTTDGGLNWISLTSGTTEDLTDIEFCDLNIGYIVGSEGTILKTTDGGSTWISQSSGTYNDLLSVDFVDARIGYSVGGEHLILDSFRILKTTDGGLNWLEKPLPTQHTDWTSLNTVEFVDANTGWIGIGTNAMHTGSIYKTTDGGDTWTQQYYGYEENVAASQNDNYTLDIGDGIRSISFKDSNNGYAVSGTIGYARAILTTTNGGSTWIQKYYDWESDGLLSVYVSTTGKGWAVGFAGIIFITEDDGNSWVQILSGIKSYFYSGDDIYSLYCINENIGWAVGYRRGGGGGPIIFNTTDGGNIWKTQLVQENLKVLKSVYFFNENMGWAVGDGFYLTTDGGKNWVEGNINGNSLFFIDENIGWLVRETFNIYTDAIFKTTDGGVTWIPKATQSAFSVYFIDINTGWVVGKNGSIRKSTDGGETWITKTSETTNNLNCVKFYDSNIGMCVGNEGTALLSTDGGETWVPQNSGTTSDLKSVIFTNSTTVWISGSNGTISNSTDLGSSWASYDEVTENDLTSLCFINENTGWVGGMNGTILKYQNNIVPVDLISFAANVNNDLVELSWRTATEINNYGFEIERCSDMQNWNNIGFVEGHGNSSSPYSYFFTDRNAVGGNKLKYRLKQVDINGNYKYSNEIEVEIVPNPFNPNTTIRYQLPKESKIVIKIYDILGAEVKTILNDIKEPGIYEVVLNPQSLPSGTYFYRIIAGDPSTGSAQVFVETKKMILLR